MASERAFVVAVVGSRTWVNQRALDDAVDAWVAEHGRPDRVVTGDAEGADACAQEYARTRGYSLDGAVFVADWKSYGNAAGPIRNTALLKEASHVLAFCPGGQVTKGTRDTLRKACQGKRACFLFNPSTGALEPHIEPPAQPLRGRPIRA